MTENHSRYLVRIVQEIAKKHHFNLECVSYDWILRLSKADRSTCIFGYQFEINSSTSHMLANDKKASYQRLVSSHIPAVEHRLFLPPNVKRKVGIHEGWKDVVDYFYDNHQKVVCKPASGTSGNGVVVAASESDLESVFNALFSKECAICVSPFYSIVNEYRVIVLDHDIKLIYRKSRPFVLGNGSSSVLQLIQKNFSQDEQKTIFASMDRHTLLKLPNILSNQEYFPLTWKHNLGDGAKPILLERRHAFVALVNALEKLAKATSRAMGIRFFSVDIIEDENQDLKVLEVNSGVMMEAFLRHYPEKKHLVYAIYEEAIMKTMFPASHNNCFSENSSKQ